VGSASLIYLIDNTLEGQGASPRELRAVLSRMHEGVEILTEPYHAVSLKRVKSLRPSHIVLSGQSHPWERYAPESLAGVIDVIKKAPQPVLGVCGGHQQIALAYGAPVDLMGRLEPGEGYAGAKREREIARAEHRRWSPRAKHPTNVGLGRWLAMRVSPIDRRVHPGTFAD